MNQQDLDLTPVDSAVIQDYLREGDDFAFEMEIVRLCRDHCDRTFHGGRYQDPFTNISRQYDIRMQFIQPLEMNSPSARMALLAIECKRLQPFKPLVVSRMPRQAQHEAFLDILFTRSGITTSTVYDSRPDQNQSIVSTNPERWWVRPLLKCLARSEVSSKAGTPKFGNRGHRP